MRHHKNSKHDSSTFPCSKCQYVGNTLKVIANIDRLLEKIRCKAKYLPMAAFLLHEKMVIGNFLALYVQDFKIKAVPSKGMLFSAEEVF